MRTIKKNVSLLRFTQQRAVLDAGFTELIRPAMYDAYHHSVTGGILLLIPICLERYFLIFAKSV